MAIFQKGQVQYLPLLVTRCKCLRLHGGEQFRAWVGENVGTIHFAPLWEKSLLRSSQSLVVKICNAAFQLSRQNRFSDAGQTLWVFCQIHRRDSTELGHRSPTEICPLHLHPDLRLDRIEPALMAAIEIFPR